MIDAQKQKQSIHDVGRHTDDTEILQYEVQYVRQVNTTSTRENAGYRRNPSNHFPIKET